MNPRIVLGFGLGPLVSALLGLVTVPLVAWAFSPEDVGRLNLLQVVLSLSLLLTVLGLDQAYVREYHGAQDRAALLSACFLPGFMLLVVCIAATAAWGDELSYWLFDNPAPQLYAITALCMVANYISRFLSLILRMQERGVAFSMSQVIPKALQLLLLGAVILLGLRRDFMTLLWTTLASTLAVVMVYAWNTRGQWKPAITARPGRKQIYCLLQFGTPLVFSGLAYWGLTATSTLVVRSQSTLSELGIYAVTTSFAAVGSIFQSIFTVVWAPTVYKWVAEGVDMTRVDTVARQALAVGYLIITLVGCFSWLTDYVLPPHYFQVKYLVVCAIVPPLLYTLSEITCVGIGIVRRTMLTVWVTLAALATNIMISLWLVPTNGAAGAIIANAVAYMVFFVGRTEASAKVWRQFPRTLLYTVTVLILSQALLTINLGNAMPFGHSILWIVTLPVVFLILIKEMSSFGYVLRSKLRH